MFEVISRLGTNLAKYEIVPVGVIAEKKLLANTLGCKVSALPNETFGTPLVLGQ